MVAVVDTTRGPVLRTSPADAVTERTEQGPGDRVLRLLVRRTPSPARGGKPGGVAGGRAQPGHTRASTHRPTGKYPCARRRAQGYGRRCDGRCTSTSTSTR